MNTQKDPPIIISIEQKIYDEIGNEVNSFIKEHKKIYLEANPSYGKTYHFAQLGNLIKSQKSIYNRLIFCTPRLIIQEQIANTLSVDFILNGDSNLKELKDSDKIITSTYNSLHLIANQITDNDLIVIDEAHELLRNFYSRFKENKNPYYNKILQTLYNSTSSLVLMSGTPTNTFHELLNLKHLKIVKEKENKTLININFFDIKAKEMAYRFCEKYTEEFPEDCLNIIYIKNINDCGEIAIYLNDKGFKSRALTSKNKSDDVYLNVSKNNIIPKDIQFIITTNVISVGTNIYNTNIGGIVMIDEYDPIEIKQFSKRFRNAENLTIDVSNSIKNINHYSKDHIEQCHKINKEITFQQIELQKNLSKKIDKKEVDQFIEMSFEKSDTGTPGNVINQILLKFLSNESFLRDETVKSYSTPNKLKIALQNFNDINACTPVLNSQIFNDLQESKSSKIKIEFKDKVEKILNDFINNESPYAFYSTNVLNQFGVTKTEKFKHYLVKSIDFGNIKKTELMYNINSVLFKNEVLEPLLNFIPYFDNLKLCLKFLKDTIPEQRKKHILSLYVCDLVENNFDIISKGESYSIEYKKDTDIHKPSKRNEKLILDIVKEVFFYTIHNRVLHIRDLRDFLENNKLIQGLIKVSDKDNFPFDMLTTDKLNTNFLLGLVKGLFVINSKKGRFKNKKYIVKRCYIYENEINKFKKPKVLTFDISYKKSQTSNQFHKEKSIRIVSSKYILNSKFL